MSSNKPTIIISDAFLVPFISLKSIGLSFSGSSIFFTALAGNDLYIFLQNGNIMSVSKLNLDTLSVDYDIFQFDVGDLQIWRSIPCFDKELKVLYLVEIGYYTINVYKADIIGQSFSLVFSYRQGTLFETKYFSRAEFYNNKIYLTGTFNYWSQVKEVYVINLNINLISKFVNLPNSENYFEVINVVKDSNYLYIFYYYEDEGRNRYVGVCKLDLDNGAYLKNTVISDSSDIYWNVINILYEGYYLAFNNKIYIFSPNYRFCLVYDFSSNIFQIFDLYSFFKELSSSIYYYPLLFFNYNGNFYFGIYISFWREQKIYLTFVNFPIDFSYYTLVMLKEPSLYVMDKFLIKLDFNFLIPRGLYNKIVKYYKDYGNYEEELGDRVFLEKDLPEGIFYYFTNQEYRWLKELDFRKLI